MFLTAVILTPDRANLALADTTPGADRSHLASQSDRSKVLVKLESRIQAADEDFSLEDGTFRPSRSECTHDTRQPQSAGCSRRGFWAGVLQQRLGEYCRKRRCVLAVSIFQGQFSASHQCGRSTVSTFKFPTALLGHVANSSFDFEYCKPMEVVVSISKHRESVQSFVMSPSSSRCTVTSR